MYSEFILHGYRINYHSYKILFKSLGQCHNETTNIWSHLLGVVVFVCFSLLDYSKASGAATFESLTAPPLITDWCFDQVVAAVVEEKCEWLRDQSPNLLRPEVSKIVDRMRKLELDLKSSFANYDQSEMNRYS